MIELERYLIEACSHMPPEVLERVNVYTAWRRWSIKDRELDSRPEIWYKRRNNLACRADTS
jgi:hypothetical protein